MKKNHTVYQVVETNWASIHSINVQVSKLPHVPLPSRSLALLLAENGHPTYQYFFSAAINARSNYPDRLVQAYKWAFLSILLGEQQSKDILSYLAHSLSQEEIARAGSLAEDWLSSKFDEDNYEEKTKWSQTLRKLIAGNSFDE